MKRPVVAKASHRVWRVGADIDTDALAPGAWMQHGVEVIAQHCLESVRPEFAAQVRPGDVLAAGPNFGIGSSREQAAAALRHLGVAAVIAPSYSGLFFRNAFNLGLLLLTCARAHELAEGEQVAIDARAGRIVTGAGRTLPTDPIPGFLLDMVEAGGLLPQLKQRYPARSTP
ncbi:3-isopropylmalate dehydratase small subunit [Ramlibacter tataouinensis]|uniref:Alpha-IPM isomerase n=1 Tax=Ramlibacter tataouinensis (strain ATCC BAA-407 / DSM 14655 / LMG 21543 / TTB310) TaxID=365046 RepID=F5XWI2_RAMTT|nr:3-isopropylmalate dehydratase small subunit [Ramlibacter tataouinensis]AEG92936.1 Alpha-IPM isomerase [Ramlibacter tataouinensis TTB310]